jgi:hypothetical protein
MATALEEIEKRMAALEGATPDELKARNAELDAQLGAYKTYASGLEGARKGREKGFGFEDPALPATQPARPVPQISGAYGPPSPAEQARNLAARQDLATRMSQRMSSDEFMSKLEGFEKEADALNIEPKKFTDFWVKGAENRYEQKQAPTAAAKVPQITDTYGPPTPAQQNLEGRQGLAARMSQRMDPESFMKKLEGFKAEADKLGVTPEQFQKYSDRVNPSNVMREQMTRSKDLESKGFSGLAGKERDEAARTAGMPMGYDRGAKPIADFATRLERMATSAERRGHRGTAAAMSSAAGQFKTQEEFNDWITEDMNPVVAERLKGYNDYRDYFAGQLEANAEAEGEELAGRRGKDGAKDEDEDGGRVSRANETDEERRARLQKRRDDKRNYRGKYSPGYGPDDEESD